MLRARAVAERLGIALRDARRATGMTQADVAEWAGVSQGMVSLLERGRGDRTSIETWSCVAASVGEQLVGFLEVSPGASPPRNRASPAAERTHRERGRRRLARDPGVRSRYGLGSFAVDRRRPYPAEPEGGDRRGGLGLVRRRRGRACGPRAKLISLTARLSAEHHTSAADWRVRGLFVVRDTRRNRSIVMGSSPSSSRESGDRPMHGSRLWGHPSGLCPTEMACFGATVTASSSAVAWSV